MTKIDRHSRVTPARAARLIGVPVKDWPGRCHEIAGLCLSAGLVEGMLRYGMWAGPIAPDAPVFGGRGSLTHHGWVELDGVDLDVCSFCGCLEEEHAISGFVLSCENDGCDCPDFQSGPSGPVVFDPTRWVFENDKPYIFEGVDREGYYDLAGDRLRLSMLRPYPTHPQPWNSEAFDEERVLEVEPKAWAHLACVISSHDGPDVSRAPSLPLRGWVWIANLPLALLGPYAGSVYQALDQAGLGAFVPLDNREVALGDGFYGQRKACDRRIIEKGKKK